MIAKSNLAVMLVALALLGCKGVQPSAAASSGASDDAVAAEGASPASSSSGGTSVEFIHDPTLNNMNAVPVTIPAGWRFRGAFYQGGGCGQKPFAVWRASSPDDMSLIEMMPVMSWKWGNGPVFATMKQGDCLPLSTGLTPQQFLRYVATSMNVQYVADEPVPDERNQSLQNRLQKYHAAIQAGGNTPPKETVAMAWANVRSMHGSTAIRGRLMVEMDCQETDLPARTGLSPYTPGVPVHVVTTGPPEVINNCSAMVGYAAAPEAQFDSSMHRWMSQRIGMQGGLNTFYSATGEWVNAWSNRYIAFRQASDAQMNRDALRQRQIQQQQFENTMAMQQEIHNQFLSTLQRGTAFSMARTQDAMNARGTATSDWVDYALDRQSVMDTNTGLVGKVSNQVTPVAPLEKVHGDGTPIH